MSQYPQLVTRVEASSLMGETQPPLLASDQFIDLLPGYLDARRNDVSRLRTAFASGALSEIRFIGHRIRGTGGSYGLPTVTKIAAELELSADNGDASGVARGIDALDRELAHAAALLDSVSA